MPISPFCPPKPRLGPYFLTPRGAPNDSYQYLTALNHHAERPLRGL